MKRVLAYSRVVFAESLLPDGQSVVEQMGSLFVFVLIPRERESARSNIISAYKHTAKS